MSIFYKKTIAIGKYMQYNYKSIIVEEKKSGSRISTLLQYLKTNWRNNVKYRRKSRKSIKR